MIHSLIHFFIHHWALVITVAFILFAIYGVIMEMLFDRGPLDHDEDTWGSN